MKQRGGRSEDERGLKDGAEENGIKGRGEDRGRTKSSCTLSSLLRMLARVQSIDQ